MPFGKCYYLPNNQWVSVFMPNAHYAIMLYYVAFGSEKFSVLILTELALIGPVLFAVFCKLLHLLILSLYRLLL